MLLYNYEVSKYSRVGIVKASIVLILSAELLLATRTIFLNPSSDQFSIIQFQL